MTLIALAIVLAPSQLPPRAPPRPCECCAPIVKPLSLTPAPRAPFASESFHEVHG